MSSLYAAEYAGYADRRRSTPARLFVGNRPLRIADAEPLVAVRFHLDEVVPGRIRLAAILREKIDEPAAILVLHAEADGRGTIAEVVQHDSSAIVPVVAHAEDLVGQTRHQLP